MTQPLAVTAAITNLNEAYQRLNLRPANRPDFLSEWQSELLVLFPEKIGELPVTMMSTAKSGSGN